jgi:hypothetical protein
MKKKPPVTPETEPGGGVVHIRVDREIKTGLAAIAAQTGKSSNDLAVGALAEFIEIMKTAGEIEAGLRTGKHHASDFLDLLGVFWINRLNAMGLAGIGMRAAWKMHLLDNQALIAEGVAGRSETAERRKGKQS